MTHLLDTNAVIDVGTDPDLLTALPADAVTHLSVVTVVEFSYGVAAARTPARAATASNQLVAALQLWRPVPVDTDVAVVFQRVARHAVAVGQEPRARMNDLMIAATALRHGWVLVTADEQLLRAVDGLLPALSLRR